MAFDRAAARAAGYSEEEINAFLQSQPADRSNTGPVAPGQEDSVTEPPPPTTVVTPPGEGSMMSGLATAGLGAAKMLGPAAGAAVVGYGLGRYGGRAADAVRNLVSGGPVAPNNMVQPMTGNAPAPSSSATRIPITTTPAPASSPILDAQGRPMMRPTAPAPAAPAAPAPAPAQQISNAQRIIQSLALDKVLRGAGAATAAMMPSNVGQNYNFPTKGRFAGMEINPMTGRPWTPQELAQIR